MAAAYEVREDIAVITLDNPPVNGLGFDTRRDLVDGVQRAGEDDAIRAIVVTGRARRFLAGRTPRSSTPPKPCRNPLCSRRSVRSKRPASP